MDVQLLFEYLKGQHVDFNRRLDKLETKLDILAERERSNALQTARIVGIAVGISTLLSIMIAVYAN